MPWMHISGGAAEGTAAALRGMACDAAARWALRSQARNSGSWAICGVDVQAATHTMDVAMSCEKWMEGAAALLAVVRFELKHC